MSPTRAETCGPSAPTRVGAYEILLPIASGGMATVYLARHHGVGGFEREVAIKFLHAHLRGSSQETDFLEEAKLAARVRHPNVVNVLDVGISEDGPYLVMEYVEGDTLSGLLRSGGLRPPLPTLLRILCDSLGGLQASHELRNDKGFPLGLVHRDFSPQNILVGTDGVGRLTDFGIAKAASRLTFTEIGTVKGKVGYMAPEQLRGTTVDQRCDVWAAGVVAWEIFAGRRLYEFRDLREIAARLTTEPPPLLRTIEASISPDVERVVASALTIEPSARCATAGELRRGLAQAATLADQEQVAAFVREATEGKLEERRFRVQSVRRVRHEAPTEATPSVPDPAVVAPLVAPPKDPDAGPAPKARRSAALWSAVLAGPVFATAIALYMTKTGRANGPERAPVVAPSVTPPVATSVDSVAAAATLSAPSFPPPSPSTPPEHGELLAVGANAPMRELRVGGRVIPLPKPQNTIAIDTTLAERTGQVIVEAVAIDGRHATARLQAGSRELRLTFRRAASLAQDPTASVASSGLAPDPYRK